MTEIEAKALALLDEMAAKHNRFPTTYTRLERGYTAHEALYRSVEQHEAFKQEVSDVMTYIKALYPTLPRNFDRFIIPKPKPDPLVEVFAAAFEGCHIEDIQDDCAKLRAALEARGLEIREKK
jgi:hypothetical protein